MSDSVSSTPETSGGSPGTILRRCREFHGITLEEAAEATKIGISHLKALEDDKIHEFANQAYLKGFLRIYATYLGLNSDDVARMYDKIFGVQGEKRDPTRSSVTPAHQPRRLIPIKKMLFPALLLAAILITATFFKRPPALPARQSQPVAVVVPSVQDKAVQMVQSSARNRKADTAVPAPKEQVRPPEPTEPEDVMTRKRPAESPSGFILKIRVTQNGTLTATVDGSAPQQYDLASGDAIEWKAEKKVTLDLSNAGGVDVELNGKPHKPLGPLGEPAYVEIDADGAVH